MRANDINSFATVRAKLQADHEQALQRRDLVENAHRIAVERLSAWVAGRDGRDGRIWLGESGALMVSLGLAKTEIFADAEEAFCAAQDALRSAFPAEWEGSWRDVEDKSSELEAARGSTLTVAPKGKFYSQDGACVWLTIYAPVGEGVACQVIKVGERQRETSVRSYVTEPVFKSVCPGDPITSSAEAA